VQKRPTVSEMVASNTPRYMKGAKVTETKRGLEHKFPYTQITYIQTGILIQNPGW
jgi:hypothetical protein